MPLKTINLNVFFSPCTRRSLLTLTISLFLGLIWMVQVSSPGTGLDPSWSLGLTKAHEEGLQWGRDIIFTYGPFGYLFVGDLIGKNFWEMQVSRYLLSTSTILLSLNYLAAHRTNTIKAIGLMCLVLVPALHLSMRWEVSFWIIIQLIILDLSKSYQSSKKYQLSSLKIYFYGVFGTFLLLVKFSFGFAAIVGLTLVSLFELGWNLYQEKSLDLTILGLFNWLLYGYLSGLLIFFSPLAAAPEVAIIITVLPGIIASLLLKYLLLKARNSPGFKLIQKGVTLIILLSLLLLVAVNSALRDFILGSLQISSGYSYNMSVIGNPVELAIGFVIFSLMIFLGISAIAVDPRRNSGIALTLLGLVLINFKHGFIRHDSHVLLFALAGPGFLFNLGMLSLDSFSSELRLIQKTTLKRIWLGTVSVTILFALGLGIDNPVTDKYYSLNLESYIENIFNPSIAYEKASLLIEPERYQNQILLTSKETLRPSLIDSPLFLSNLLDQSVEVVPWEISITEANQLRWHPAPIFQVYAAYTSWLDRKNLSHYQTDPPDRIIYNNSTIDGRHPYFEQPLTTLFRLCNYTYLPLPTKKIDRVGNVAILRKRKTPLCKLGDITPVGQALFGEWEKPFDLKKVRSLYSNEPGNILLVQAKIRHSLWGKIHNFLLGTPPVYLHATYDDNQVISYRMMINNSKDHTIIGSLPTTFNEFLQDFDGKDSANPVQIISISSPDQTIFSSKIELQFSRLKKQIDSPQDFRPDYE